jgi:hypothetical protein
MKNDKLEFISDQIRQGIPVGIYEAIAAPECRPMTLAEIKLNPVISYFGVESGEKIVRAVEAFHGIKEQP